MTAENIMNFRLIKLSPADRICDALRLMHTHQIRNLPVVDDEGRFVGLFGLRRMLTLLLPKAAQIDFGLEDLSFMPDEVGELYRRLDDIWTQPVTEYLEKEKNLVFCDPSTTFPEVLELLKSSPNASLPVIVVRDGKLIGLVSAWDVLDRLMINMLSMKDGRSRIEDCDQETGDAENEPAENGSPSTQGGTN